jgi:excisionase family DNA binding protein
MTTTTTKTDAARTELEPLLTIEDLERLLRVDKRTIRRLWERGEIPAPMKIGHANRWRMKDLKQIL